MSLRVTGWPTQLIYVHSGSEGKGKSIRKRGTLDHRQIKDFFRPQNSLTAVSGRVTHLRQLSVVCVQSEPATVSEAQAGGVTPQLCPPGCPFTQKLTSSRGRRVHFGDVAARPTPAGPILTPNPVLKVKVKELRRKHRGDLIKVLQHLRNLRAQTLGLRIKTDFQLNAVSDSNQVCVHFYSQECA